MPRTDQNGRAFRGSQHQFQTYVNYERESLNRELALLFGDSSLTVDWRSPLIEHRFREYKDAAFLKMLDLSLLAPELSKFWPLGGPVWDGLAIAHSKQGTLRLLFEAKSHVAELNSRCTATASTSVSLIHRSLLETQLALQCKPLTPWSESYYQYANRLAHLRWLDSRVPTRLVNVYFLNDSHDTPTSLLEWNAAIAKVKACLGLSSSVQGSYDLFLPAKEYV